LDRHGYTIQHRPSRTHPGAEDGAVRGFLMMSVVGFVSDRPGGGETADDKDTEHQQGCKRLSCSAMTHVVSIDAGPTFFTMYWSPALKVKMVFIVQPCVFLMGFINKMLYTGLIICAAD
jgi:hypothetical protein